MAAWRTVAQTWSQGTSEELGEWLEGSKMALKWHVLALAITLESLIRRY
jgi:hypothetical protein